MKNNQIQQLKGSTLKTQIYNSISRNKLANTTKLLRNTLTTHLKHPSFKSQKVQMKTQIFSPAPKTQTSIHKMSRSVNDTYNHHKNHTHTHNSINHVSKDILTKIQSKKQKQKSKSQSQIILKNRSPQNKNNASNSYKKLEILSTQKKNTNKKQKIRENLKEKQKNKQKNSKSMSKSIKNINLQSIIEQSSSQQQLITPQNKHKKYLSTPQSKQKTKKKQQCQILSQNIKKKLERSFKEPQIFQKILKTTYFTICYRILKKRLIQIEIYTLKDIELLKIILDKGNLQCQSLQQEYRNVSNNTVLALFSSVRNVSLNHVRSFPKIQVEFTQGDECFQKIVNIPYTWLHFTEEKAPSLKKSKIKTKICLSDIPLSRSNLNILSCIFHTWLKKSFKGHSQFQTTFTLQQQQYTIRLLQQLNQRFTLQLQGKGQDRLTNMVQFIQDLIK